mmetsp:Transcript_1689/g.2750  ORF Transcript_1689/g.2750 Transcript_1689/m.2750 type:complete len:96 (-) Transcript_1689:1366-1653(-)
MYSHKYTSSRQRTDTDTTEQHTIPMSDTDAPLPPPPSPLPPLPPRVREHCGVKYSSSKPHVAALLNFKSCRQWNHRNPFCLERREAIAEEQLPPK